LSDESPLAALTAKMHPNIDHVVCRSRRGAAFDRTELIHRLHQNPIAHLSNQFWWNDINGEAKQRGATVLLSGEVGNFALSAGGEKHLVDLLRERGLVKWWREARAIAGLSPLRWRSVLNLSLGPHLPRPFYSSILMATGRSSAGAFDFPFLRSPFRQEARELLEDQFSDDRPPCDFFAYRAQMLYRREGSEKISLAGWGIEPRDPTSDRRLVEFCFSLPIEQLVSAGAARPLFDQAMADRIPRAVLASTRRGYQAADWHEVFTRDEVAERFRVTRRNPLVATLINTEHVQRLIDGWPVSGWDDRSALYLYRNTVLGLVTLAEFINSSFADA
jgi:asparagine synthase (glutamine-hydrolysing)